MIRWLVSVVNAVRRRFQRPRFEADWQLIPFDFRVDWFTTPNPETGLLSRASLASQRPVAAVPQSTRLCWLCDPAKGLETKPSVAGL